MKIVYVYARFIDRAGTERVWADKMNYLSEIPGYEVVLLTYEQGNHPLAFPLSQKVRHVDLHTRFYALYKFSRLKRLFMAYRLRQTLRKRFNDFMMEFQPDVTISSTYFPDIMSMIVRCPVKTVRLLESHIDKRFVYQSNPGVEEHFLRKVRSMWNLRMAENSARHFDMLIALTKEDADDWSKFVPVKVIKNVVHLRADGAYNSCSSRKVVFAGRLEYQKGIMDLVEIWKQVHERHPDWQLDIYGNGSMEGELQQEGIKQVNINLHAADEQILDRFSESSIFVLTSVFEPFGLVIVEAMSCGLPVVVFDCPYGPATIIEDGKNGFLVENRNIGKFVDCLCRLIENQDLRQEMGRAGMTCAKQYAAEKIMPKWVALFNSLVSEKGDVDR